MRLLIVVEIVVVVFAMESRHIQFRLLIPQPDVDVVTACGASDFF
jgi:hypothetical protein